MLASAARAYLERFGVLVGQRVVVFSTNHAGHETAEALHAAGAHVTVIDPSPKVGKASERLHAAGIEVHRNAQVVATEGDPALREVTILGADGYRSSRARGRPGGQRRLEPRPSSSPAGWASVSPTTTPRRASCTTAPGPSWLHVVGAAAGDVPAAYPIWVIDDGDDAEKYVEPQRDQTVADVAKAVAGGLTSAEHVKRATYIGTTIDQGRTSGVLTAEVVNQLLGWAPGAQGPTNARPPYTPIPFSALAGIDGGPTLLDPIRVTPIHDWHEAHGAVYENVGQWKRPRYFPRRRRGHGRRGRARMPRGANRRGPARCEHAGQDRRLRARRRRVPRPDVHEPDVEPGRGLDPVRVDARASTGWSSTTASRCAWRRTATS